MNIFSLRDQSPDELLIKLKTKGLDAVNSDGNDYEKGKWDDFLENAKLIVPAWGDCDDIVAIKLKKNEVIKCFFDVITFKTIVNEYFFQVREWLNTNWKKKLGYVGKAGQCFTQRENPFHPKGWKSDFAFMKSDEC